jgi:hypothetical protein
VKDDEETGTTLSLLRGVAISLILFGSLMYGKLVHDNN